jgi:uncharacterized membrane protein YedE/YeeE
MEAAMHPYVLALIGGVLIGVSAVLLMAFSGRIAGISGIVAGLLPPNPAKDRTWRIAFILGLLLAPTLLALTTGDNRIGAPAVGPALLIAAGLLVGVGTALSNGCTSGHGICGVSRLSARSITAVIVFVAAAMLTVFVTRHVL